MSGFLVALEVTDRDVLVVGGGAVAERKVTALLAAGARVRVIAPEVTDGLRALADAGRLRWLARGWEAGDTAEARLVFAATDRPEVNRAAAAEARDAGLWCNVATPPEAGDMQVLAAVHDGPLAVGISTAGASPLVARKLRERLETVLPPGLGALIGLLGEVRGEVQERYAEESARRAVYEQIWSSEALARLQSGDVDGARALVRACVEDAPSHG